MLIRYHRQASPDIDIYVPQIFYNVSLGDWLRAYCHLKIHYFAEPWDACQWRGVAEALEILYAVEDGRHLDADGFAGLIKRLEALCDKPKSNDSD